MTTCKKHPYKINRKAPALGLFVADIRQSTVEYPRAEAGMVVSAQTLTESPPAKCRRCGSEDFALYGGRTKMLTDAPHNGGPVVLSVKYRRWRCRSCQSVVAQRIKCQVGERRVTERLMSWMAKNRAQLTLAQMARQTGLSDRTVSSLTALARESIEKTPGKLDPAQWRHERREQE